MWANFFRIKVESTSLESTKGCTGYLTRIEKDGKTKWGIDNAQLTFAHGEDPDALSKTIRNKVPEFLDVLAVGSNNEIRIATKGRVWRYTPLVAEIFSEPGDYLLTVAITGDNVQTETLILKFTWTRNWQTAALTLVPESPDRPTIKSHDRHSETMDKLNRYGLAQVPPQAWSMSLEAAHATKTPIELMDDAIAEGEKVERFCEGFHAGSECQKQANTWIENTRTILRACAPSYVASFNDTVARPFTTAWLPQLGRTIFDMARWRADRDREMAWRLVSSSVNQLRSIRSKVRATLPS